MNLKDWLPKFKRSTISLPKDSTFWSAVGQVVAAVAAVIMVAFGYFQLRMGDSQLRMAYDEAKEHRTEAASRREHEELMLKAMSTPHLALDFTDREVGRATNKNGRIVDWDAKEASWKIRNYGTGPALNCRAEFHVTQIEFADVAETQEIRREDVQPSNLMPGQQATMRLLPSCMRGSESPKSASGYILFKCRQIDGNEVEFKETFFIAQNRDANSLAYTSFGPQSSE